MPKPHVTVLAALCASIFSLAGCMTSRGVCTVKAPGEVARATTRNRYRIAHIQERLADGRIVDVHSNRRMREMLDDTFGVEELTSYAPGVWATDGIPVTVTFVNWRNTFDVHWSIVPCVLTLGICPYCHHEDIVSRVEVSRDDGGGSVAFEYAEGDDWKISFLFACGSIPYSEKVLSRNEFQKCGSGDVLSAPHMNGLAHGMAAALAELERQSAK